MIGLPELRDAAKVRGTRQDAYLKALEVAAVDFLHARSGRYYGPPQSGYVEYVVAMGERVIILEEEPNATTAVAVVEHVTPGDSGTTITAGADDGYVQRGRKLVRKGGHVWLPGYEYAITYDRGYESGKEPPRARQFVRGLVVHWFERRIPMPKVGETLTFDVPHHLSAILGTLSRLRV